MAATSGLCAVAGKDVATDLINHILVNSGTVATAVTITGPNKVALLTSSSTNKTLGAECADANYSRISVSWGSAATTEGAGYSVGYVGKNSSALMTFFPSGAAVQQVLAGTVIYSNDATPIPILYANFAAAVTVPAGSQYTVAAGSCSGQLS